MRFLEKYIFCGYNVKKLNGEIFRSIFLKIGKFCEGRKKKESILLSKMICRMRPLRQECLFAVIKMHCKGLFSLLCIVPVWNFDLGPHIWPFSSRAFSYKFIIYSFNLNVFPYLNPPILTVFIVRLTWYFSTISFTKSWIVCVTIRSI